MRATLVRAFVMTGLFLGLATMVLPQDETDPLILDATYTDHFAGYTFNYPAAWELSPAEFQPDQTGSTTILQSTPEQGTALEQGTADLPDNVTKIDFTPAFQFGSFPSVPDLAAWEANNREPGMNETLWQEDWKLFGEYYAIREQIESQRAGEVAILYFMFSNKVMMMVGYNNLQPFDAIARTLRPAIVGEIKSYTDETMSYTFDYPASWQLEPAVYEDGQMGQVNRVNQYNADGVLTAWIEFSPIFQFNEFDTLDEYADLDQRLMQNEGMGIQLRREDVALYGGMRGIRAINDTELAGQVAVLYFSIDGRAFVAAGYNRLEQFDAIAGSVRPARA